MTNLYSLRSAALCINIGRGICSPHLSRSILRKVTISRKLEVTLVTSMMVDNIHLAMVINPKFTNNNVMNCSGNLSPCVVITSLRESAVSNTYKNQLLLITHAEGEINYVTELQPATCNYKCLVTASNLFIHTKWNNLKVFSSELAGHSKLLLEDPASLALSIHSAGRWVVTNLLS